VVTVKAESVFSRPFFLSGSEIFIRTMKRRRIFQNSFNSEEFHAVKFENGKNSSEFVEPAVFPKTR